MDATKGHPPKVEANESTRENESPLVTNGCVCDLPRSVFKYRRGNMTNFEFGDAVGVAPLHPQVGILLVYHSKAASETRMMAKSYRRSC